MFHISLYSVQYSTNCVLYFFIQALFLRTSWAESQMLRQSNLVADCKDTPDTDCCDGGCISIEAFELGSDDETELDDDDTESD